ncbi:hypothetical protein MRX96_043564 [Rhipicephalus microplus]
MAREVAPLRFVWRVQVEASLAQRIPAQDLDNTGHGEITQVFRCGNCPVATKLMCTLFSPECSCQAIRHTFTVRKVQRKK